MNNLQFKINKLKVKVTIFLVMTLVLGCAFLIVSSPTHAQSLGLSISPPIDEIMIIPGHEVIRTFTITNDGNDGAASIYIVPFRAQGENGNVALDEKGIIDTSSPFASWFTLTSPVSSFGEKFYMAGGQKQNVSIKVSPPEGIAQKDYYFTLLYELDNNIPGGITLSGPTNQARIGANLLISVSEDGKPEKTPNIVEFSAPKVVDSLGKLDFNIRIGNFGSYAFKPVGTITIKPTFGPPETLTLVPFNVISDSIRKISCLNNEETFPCTSKSKVLVGIYKSTLSMSVDGGDTTQEKTVTTVAFPFSITLGLIFILSTYQIVRSARKKTKLSS